MELIKEFIITPNCLCLVALPAAIGSHLDTTESLTDRTRRVGRTLEMIPIFFTTGYTLVRFFPQTSFVAPVCLLILAHTLYTYKQTQKEEPSLSPSDPSPRYPSFRSGLLSASLKGINICLTLFALKHIWPKTQLLRPISTGSPDSQTQRANNIAFFTYSMILVSKLYSFHKKLTKNNYRYN